MNDERPIIEIRVPQAFRKVPVEITAMQLIVDDLPDEQANLVADWCGGKVFKTSDRSDAEFYVQIETLEGTMTASPGDWVIRGVNGEFYPCKPDIFAKTYVPAALPPTPETDDLIDNPDALVWAERFNQMAQSLGYSQMDEGWLLGWFANAMQAQATADRKPNAPENIPAGYVQAIVPERSLVFAVPEGALFAEVMQGFRK